MTRIAAYIPNLMDRSRFASHVEMLLTLDDLKSANADLILIDVQTKFLNTFLLGQSDRAYATCK